MIRDMKATIGALLPKNVFARGVGLLVSGTTGAQVLLVLSAPILARLYTPQEFGLLAVFVSLVALIDVFSSFRYEQAILLPVDDAEAANVLVLSLLLVVVSSSLAALLVSMLGAPIAELLGVPSLNSYWWLLPIGIFLSGVYSIFNLWALRTKRYSTIAGTKILQAIAALAIQLVTFKLGGVGLILGQIASQSVGTGNLARSSNGWSTCKQVSWSGIKLAALRYKRFPIFSTWAGLANTAGTQLPAIMFSALFTPAAAGLYALANRVLQLPISLVGGAIGHVFFANGAQARREGKLGSLTEQVHGTLAQIGLPLAFLLMLIGPELFSFVFGESWRQAGEFARWMTPWLYLSFVTSPISKIFFVAERQKDALIFQLVMLSFRVLAVLLGYWLNDLLITVILFAGASALCYAGFLFMILHIAGSSVHKIVQPTLKAAAFSVLCNLPVLLTLLMTDAVSNMWLYGLALSLLLIGGNYYQLLKSSYELRVE